MTIPIIYLLSGILLLVAGGDGTVRGATSFARRLKIKPYVIGATIVAFGTSAPELIVTLMATLRGSSDIALGNVIGSNIANLGLILGLSALFGALVLAVKTIRTESPVVIAVLLLLVAFAWDGTVSRIEASILLILLIIVTWNSMRSMNVTEDEEETETGEPLSIVVSSAFLIIGIGALIGGGHLLVKGAVEIAHIIGIPEWIIGIGIVSVGTSLPEVAASVTAAVKGRGDIAIGNVFGSNTFNVLLVLGVGAEIRPLNVLQTIKFDLVFLGGLTIFSLFLLVSLRRIPKWSGLTLLAAYIIYLYINFAGLRG